MEVRGQLVVEWLSQRLYSVIRIDVKCLYIIPFSSCVPSLVEISLLPSASYLSKTTLLLRTIIIKITNLLLRQGLM